MIKRLNLLQNVTQNSNFCVCVQMLRRGKRKKPSKIYGIIDLRHSSYDLLYARRVFLLVDIMFVCLF